jgi:hypothetical protein
MMLADRHHDVNRAPCACGRLRTARALNLDLSDPPEGPVAAQ